MSALDFVLIACFIVVVVVVVYFVFDFLYDALPFRCRFMFVYKHLAKKVGALSMTPHNVFLHVFRLINV